MIKIIVYAGEKISPIEVDAILLSHPDIAQAVAFGVPDDKYGEEVMNPFSHIFGFFHSSCISFNLSVLFLLEVKFVVGHLVGCLTQ